MMRPSILAGVLAMLGLATAAARGAEPPQRSALDNGEFTAKVNGLQLWYKVSGRGPVCLMPTPGWGRVPISISAR